MALPNRIQWLNFCYQGDVIESKLTTNASFARSLSDFDG